MTEELFAHILVSLGQFLATVIALAVTGVWRLATTKADIYIKIDDSLSAHKEEVNKDLNDLKEKLSKTERWIWEEFARRDDVKSTIDSMNMISERLELRIGRIDEKLDRIIEKTG